jgi:hypothetical protein
MLDITLDTDQFRRDALKVYLAQKNALPNAVRFTLDTMAFKTMKVAKDDLSKNFTLRNTWTKRSIGVEKVGAGNDIDIMVSRVGSREGYMAEQEEGVNVTSKGEHGVPIPTPTVSGEGRASVRKKRILRKYLLSKIKTAKGVFHAAAAVSSTRKQHYALVMSMTREARKKFFYWEARRGRKGLYRLSTDEDGQPDMVYDLSHRRLTSKPVRWLSGPTDSTLPQMAKIYGKALRFQLSRLYR